jgi:hypothetical protein
VVRLRNQQLRAKGSRGFLGVTALGPERNSVQKRRALRMDYSSSGPSVFTFFKAKSKLFTIHFCGGGKVIHRRLRRVNRCALLAAGE